MFLFVYVLINSQEIIVLSSYLQLFRSFLLEIGHQMNPFVYSFDNLVVSFFQPGTKNLKIIQFIEDSE